MPYKPKRSLMRRFLSDQEGVVFIMFSVALPIVLAAVGVSVDYAKMKGDRDKLQVLADGAVLAAISGKDGGGNTAKNEAAAREAAEKFFTSARQEMGFPKAKMASFDINEDGVVTVVTEAEVDLKFGSFIGDDKKIVSSEASAVRDATNNYEIVMALDNTGSMSGEPLKDLKAAATSFVEVFEEQADENVKIGLVPFAQYVNVGKSQRNKPAFDVPPDSSEQVYRCRWKRDTIRRYDCKTVHEKRTCTNDGVTRDCSRTRTQCKTEKGPRYEVCKWETRNVRFHGCVGSRDNPLDTIAEYKTGDQKIPGLMNQKCGREVTRLTDNFKDVKNDIKRMNASGNTYLPTGVLWGWRLLSKKMPFTDADVQKEGEKPLQKILIIMTDGENTLSPKYPKHDGREPDESDDLLEEVCANAKDDGIRIMSVKVGTGDADTFLECASSEEDAILVSNSSQLEEVFEEFASKIVGPRLTN